MQRIKIPIIVCLLVLTISVVLNVGVFGIGVARASTITVYPAALELPVGTGLFLQVRSASGAAITDLQWTSSNDHVAAVSQGGFVEALSVGETVVEAVQGEDPSQRAVCRVVVTEAGKVLLYPKDIPLEPGDELADPPANPPEEEDFDDEIPVEHDPELDIPVEHDPRIDEYTWWIRIHDTITQDLEGGDFPMKVVYTLDLNAVKVGGKTSRGTYDGGATLEVRVDTSEMVEGIMKQAGGIFLSFLVDIGGTYRGDVTIEVEDYDINTYTDFNTTPGQPAIPPLVRFKGMALGEIELSGQTIAGGSSLDVSGVGINLYQPPIQSDEPISYKLALLGAGKVQMQLDLGFPESFKGQISREPFASE